MPLPVEIRVKLSSEAAGALSMTSVVAQDMTAMALLEVLLGAAGEDAARIADLLKRGTAVSGATRYRWEPLTVDTGEVAAAIAALPKSEPGRLFQWDACQHIVVYSGVVALTITAEEGRRRRWLRRRSFWDALADLPIEPRYIRYDYRLRADHFEAPLGTEAATMLRGAADLLRRGVTGPRLREARPDRLELYAGRRVSDGRGA